MTSYFDPVEFLHGPAMPNRFMLAPLTNGQSHVDGTLSDEEYKWLTMRAEGGFGMTMTCASHVMANGQGFPGQLASYSDDFLPGLSHLAQGIKQHNSVATVQIYHGGNRAPKDLIGSQPVCPSDNEEFGAREMTPDEIDEAVEAFIVAAVRCEQAGFDGVELHGAHGYLICEFLSPEVNLRKDKWGGSLENRARFLMEIISGIRKRCRPDFHLAVRLSPERFGVVVHETIEVFDWLVKSGDVDMIDMSLWDVFKPPREPGYEDKRLIDIFAGLDRGQVKLAVAGKLYTGADTKAALETGIDILAIGRAAITNHDFPIQLRKNPEFKMRSLPVSQEDLKTEGVSPPFIDYLKTWKTFVAE